MDSRETIWMDRDICEFENQNEVAYEEAIENEEYELFEDGF